MIFTEHDPLGDSLGRTINANLRWEKLPTSKLLGKTITTLLGKCIHDHAEDYSTSYPTAEEQATHRHRRWGYNNLQT